jgi:hypothetical protein
MPSKSRVDAIKEPFDPRLGGDLPPHAQITHTFPAPLNPSLGILIATLQSLCHVVNTLLIEHIVFYVVFLFTLWVWHIFCKKQLLDCP